MQPDNIDDLFRQQLGGHATPPGHELQRRLDALAADERLDTLFRAGLASHATPPPRALWERLEDEHLRPQPRRKRRVVPWWQYSAAAVLLVLLLAGSAGLWRSRYAGGGELATTQAHHRLASPGRLAPPIDAPALASQPAGKQAQATAQEDFTAKSIAAARRNQQNFSTQATAEPALPSSPPIATTTRPRRAAASPRVPDRLPTQRQQPDAAAGPLATTGKRTNPASQQAPRSQEAAATTVAPPPHDAPASLALAATPAPGAAPDIIEVDVRRGPDAARPGPPVVAAAEPTATRRPRLRLGGLLRQADHLVHGEPVSLAEATGLPETVTLQARLGGRVVSKTIQL